MSNILSKKRVLVTRPKEQADHLCKLITNSGGEPILFPTIEIQAIIRSDILSDIFEKINDYEFVIFISQNAVNVAFEYYLDHSNISVQQKIIAIGGSTAKALHLNGIENVIHVGTQADSESLLMLTELQASNVKDKKILIVRGKGGRELLAETLKSRGAKIEFAEVYQRCLPQYEVNVRQKVWQDTIPDAIIITSNESLENLLTLTLEEDKAKLFNTPLVLMSERAVELAEEFGFTSSIQLASDKNDEGLLSALIEIIGD